MSEHRKGSLDELKSILAERLDVLSEIEGNDSDVIEFVGDLDKILLKQMRLLQSKSKLLIAEAYNSGVEVGRKEAIDGIAGEIIKVSGGLN